MRTEPRETSPSLRWGVARLDGDKTHRMQALLYGSRMTQVSTKMAPMMAAMMAAMMAPALAGERILSLRVCALVASAELPTSLRESRFLMAYSHPY